MGKGTMFSIGKMSLQTGISEKRLRYYDKTGLCSPEYRDENTGYRYYSEAQIQILQWISYLRSLDIPVTQIAELLRAKNPSKLKTVLDGQVLENRKQLAQMRYRHEQSMEMRQRLYIALGHLRLAKENTTVSLVDIEPTYIFSYESDITSQNITETDRAKMFNRLREEVQRLMLITVGGDVILYRNHPLLTTENLPGKTSYLVQVKNPPAVILEHVRFLESYRAATLVHIGPHETLPEAYQKIKCWAYENGVQLGQDVIEDYQISGAMNIDPQHYVTQLYVPLQGQHL